eukprot:TRINITY_DN4147_c0_g1_i9.p1 TRINITY_DN4147_c0_g1~~TRINITY_DN4147_c0_g1_i9.p1  ORF type:complete len:366 (-),score=69.30 TRINITY_DN4147_c0_g1_i9:451-1548(-)
MINPSEVNFSGNRWRRQRIPNYLRQDTIPKNILLIGSTGVGKTEVARRMATVLEAPFIKVEATKFTEVGFHGLDVDTIIKDIFKIGINMTRKIESVKLESKVAPLVEEKLLELIVKEERTRRIVDNSSNLPVESDVEQDGEELERFHGEKRRGKIDTESLRQKLEVQLRNGELEDYVLHVAAPKPTPTDLPQIPQEGEIVKLVFLQFQKPQNPGTGPKQSITVRELRKTLKEAEIKKLLDQEIGVLEKARRLTEEYGIVFIDEIDKLCSGHLWNSSEASGEGVQKDLLPIIEGTKIQTEQGEIDTTNVLFICAGAFTNCKPSDLLPELQGRLPIRVKLENLNYEQLYRFFHVCLFFHNPFFMKGF